MKKMIMSVMLCMVLSAYAVDMQAPMSSAEAQTAYTDYQAKQASYYVGRFAPDSLYVLWGDEMFARLNELMGQTCRIDNSSFSYNSLRSEYVKVDRDLNIQGNIIGTYNGESFSGVWDSGSTWNREHTWPQSKGASKDIPMGYDMQSVRPTQTKVNSSRGNTPFGNGSGYYNPDNDCQISNPLYNPANRGTYRGDAARIILYDYIVYGSCGNAKNKHYNGKAQLLEKLGPDGVFESIECLIAWSEDDEPSLIEMVRNDGAQDYQGNRNPFIDFPILVSRLFATEDPGPAFPNQEQAVESVQQDIMPRLVLQEGKLYILKADGRSWRL